MQACRTLSIRRIILLLTSLLPLLAACAATWIAHDWQPGAVFWDKRFRPFVATFVGGETRGYLSQRTWMLQWSHGQIAVVDAYEESWERQPYEPAPGFPYDPELAAQVRREWVSEEIRAVPTHGYQDGLIGNVQGPQDSPHWWQRLGFTLDWPPLPGPLVDSVQFATPRNVVRVAACPTWFLLCLAAAPPLQVLRIFARRVKRYAAGRCLACGYDLRASANICPECGTPLMPATEKTQTGYGP